MFIAESVEVKSYKARCKCLLDSAQIPTKFLKSLWVFLYWLFHTKKTIRNYIKMLLKPGFKTFIKM